jgi:HSP20 family molecular chaperone IbpA
VPPQAASDGVSAKLTNGVLTVWVPKRPEVAPRTIEIKTS